jgi:25S rRNA (adenine(2142)-N(1))-methyltransferase, Bmt2
MLCRLYAQLKPEKSVLFLALPIRCIRSKHVGEEEFDRLLAGLGFEQLREKRITPRVVFYVIGRKSDDSSISRLKGNARMSVHTSELPKSRSKTSTSVAPASTAADNNWMAVVQRSVTVHMNRSIWEHFTRDCSAVPPTEFSLSLRGLGLKVT